MHCVSAFLRVLFLLAAPVLYAQDFVRVVEGFSIERDGRVMDFPFFGGLDIFQPQFVDIDRDGDVDLFVAESNEGHWRLAFFENLGTPQLPEFHWRDTAHDTLRIGNWFSFVDIDADNDADLIGANGLGSLRLYRSVAMASQPRFLLEAEEWLDTAGDPVASEPTSVPAFTDIDADGDFDFFTGVTTGTIRLYRNTGTPAVPALTFETETWQNLLIISGGRTQSQATPSVVASQRHGANGICFADFDHDADPDFFYGDLFHKSVYFLRNDGTPENAHVAITDSVFPQPQAVQTNGFNIPRFADLDSDGDLDFFVACIQQAQQNFLFYRNTGAPTQPQFKIATTSFLTMLDAGSNTVPAFADLDADGDQDLLIGNVDGFFIYYQNTGTPVAPAWQWVSDNFQNLRPASFFSAAPVFVDIDGDGDFDLFSGYHFGRLAFFENRGTPQQPQFQLVTNAFENIDVGDQSTPHFADVDHDGDFDLFIGESRRNLINLYENIGNDQQSRYALKKQIRHPLIVDESVPCTYDWNGDGFLDLFVGNQLGTIVHYQGTALPDSFVYIEDKFAGIDVGFASAPVFVDFDMDGKIDVLAGERAGGLNFFRGNRSAGIPSWRSPDVPRAFDLLVHPNPARNRFRITVRSNSDRKILTAPILAIFSLMGERVAEVQLQYHDSNSWSAEWRPQSSALATGVYIVQAQIGQVRITRKLLLLR